jgi:adenosylmethionine-8-amino-7-oxononanoate aminotransferase
MPLTAAALADTRHHLHPYTQLRQLEQEGPLVIVRGDGVHVIDEHGQRYLEGMAGLWCASLGFSERRLVEAATRQMQTLPYYHSFSGKVPGPVTELVQALVRWAPVPMSRVLFANSGSESNDTAVKLVRYYNNARGRPRQKKIIARGKGYHGGTVAAASRRCTGTSTCRWRAWCAWAARTPTSSRTTASRPRPSPRGWRRSWRTPSCARAPRPWPPSSPSRCRAPAA